MLKKFSGEKLKLVRKEELKISKEELIYRLKKEGFDISFVRMSRIESGPPKTAKVVYNTDLNSKEIAVICKVTGKTPNFYFGVKDA